MADYYPLVARAIAGLDPSAPGESRRALYERARDALISQLRGVQPPLSESEITRERLALEEAVRKVESEAAQRARDASRAASSAARASPRAVHSEGAAPAATPSMAEPVPHRLLTGQRWPVSLRTAEQLKLALEEAEKRQQQSRTLEVEEAMLLERARMEREEKKLPPGVIRERLADMASPAPSLSPDGRLDAGPNVVYDAPLANNDLPTLPIRQRNLIKTILHGLPRNAPKQLVSCLESYSDELEARGVQPILGLLQDMAAIIIADVNAVDAAREWLQDGLRVAFKRFGDNHALFVTHFPLDPQREELYARTTIDETAATGHALSKPFEDIAKATFHANHAGVTTDDFLRIVDKLTEFAKATSTLPHSSRDHESSLTITSQDRLIDASEISPKKRVLLSALGFFERAYNLLGSTATLATTPQGMAFLAALEQALASLSKLVGFG
jgi:hypothetical protein